MGEQKIMYRVWGWEWRGGRDKGWRGEGERWRERDMGGEGRVAESMGATT